MNKKIILSVLTIIFIVIILFLSQKPQLWQYLLKNSNTSSINPYIQQIKSRIGEDGYQWLDNKIFNSLRQQKKIGEELIKKEFETIKKRSDEILDTKKKLEDYFSGIYASIFYPGKNLCR